LGGLPDLHGPRLFVCAQLRPELDGVKAGIHEELLMAVM